MGYSEIHCRLCGVSFNIGRKKQRHEPGWMGWQCTGDVAKMACDCPRPDHKGSDDESSMSEDGSMGEEADDQEEDPDYVDTSSEHEDPYEFESDDEVLEANSGDEMDVDSDSEDETWIRFLQKVRLPADHKCFDGQGYSGKCISAEEMRGCNTAQCLVSKGNERLESSRWTDEWDDQDYERQGDYFLSGLCNHMYSRDTGSSDSLAPIRHGARSPHVDCVVWEYESRTYWAIPFHPACFDIFTRLSRHRFGYVNFEALGKWCFNEGGHDQVYDVPRDPKVKESSQQWWAHKDGCEYLAANPLLVPLLHQILREAIDYDPNFDPQAGAFNVPDVGTLRVPESDFFGKLPLELRLQIVSYLPSRDIANLRLTSRAFRQLPMFLWRHLLAKEMPWLWEVWGNEAPYTWATIPFEAAEKEEKLKTELETWRMHACIVIKQELPEIFDEWYADVEDLLSKRVTTLEAARAEALTSMVCGLPPSNTNWYKLYTDITKNWENLKGLRNRRRVWKDMEEIVSRIEKYT